MLRKTQQGDLLDDRAGGIGGRMLDRFPIEGDGTLIAQLGLPSTYSTIDDNSIASTNVNTLCDRERPTAQIFGRAGVDELNQAAHLCDVPGRMMLVGARLSF